MKASPRTNNAVQCRALVKRYGGVTAVAGLDVEVHYGECFGMLGPNGAGKTTTMEVFEGLREPDSGEVEILGDRWQGDGLKLRERLGIQLQETKFPEKLRVAEVLTLFRSFYPRGMNVADAMEMVGLVEKASAQVRTLSGGQKQRLSLGCALVGEPELLFLDEPTTGLDPQSRRQAWEIVAGFKARGRTVLLTTHYMEEAARLCDRVAVVDHGKVIALGSPRELVASLGAEQVVEFAVGGETGENSPSQGSSSEPRNPEAPPLPLPQPRDHPLPPRGERDGVRGAQPVHGKGLTEEALRSLPSVETVSRDGDHWRLSVREVHRAVPALLALLAKNGMAPTHLTTHHATLEDVFVSLTGRRLRDG